jgi:hypothetical protein
MTVVFYVRYKMFDRLLLAVKQTFHSYECLLNVDNIGNYYK